MSKKDYLSEKQEKTRSTARGIIALLVFIIIFIAVIVRIAFRPGIDGNFFSSMPGGADAYQIAKRFIKPAPKLSDVEFPNDEYQLSKKSDSIYVITSYFDTKDTYGTNVKTNFTATLKYNGGSALNQRHWTLIKLDEH
jgi:hypothetical protein